MNPILKEIGADPDPLPLMRKWRAATTEAGPGGKPLLELRHYTQAGGGELALNQHADEVYKSLPERARGRQARAPQQIAEWLFRSLSRRTPAGQLVRQLTTAGEVARVASASEDDVRAVVESFAAQGVNFLVTSPPGLEAASTSIDISHENLLRQWNRVRQWVTPESKAASQLLKLAEDAKFWKDGRRGLLRQPDLACSASGERNASRRAIGRRSPSGRKRLTRRMNILVRVCAAPGCFKQPRSAPSASCWH